MSKKRKSALSEIEIPEVVKVSEYPAACPACQCTQRTGKHCVVKRRISGTLPDGRPYNVVKNWRAECKNCGQRLGYNSFENELTDD